ncbi:oxidoreductase [Brevundimonas sp. GN22]
MTGRLHGKVAVITGGGQGVGEGIARTFAAAGANIVIAQRSEQQAQMLLGELASAHGARTLFVPADVTVRQQVEDMISRTTEAFGRLDVLVNNAGASSPERLERMTDETMDRSFRLNYWAVFWAMRAAFPVMKAQGAGRIINMGSLNGVNAHMFTADYNASKEAMRALSRTAAVEWGPHGITVNVICPSATSPQAKEYFEQNPEMMEHLVSQIPAGRLGHAHGDIGPLALYLASDESGFLTGNTLFADGGAHINGLPWRPAVAD